MQINLTASHLTRAQLGQDQTVNTGETLCAVPLDDGTWKYILSFEGQVVRIRYAEAGLASARWALNASEEDYNHG